MKKLLFLLTLFITSIIASSYAWANFSISGSVLYRNATNTPMNATQVKLYQGSTLIKDTIANYNGEYIFNNIPVGSYRIEASTSKVRDPKCFNIQDVALIRMFVGKALAFDSLQIKASNANMDMLNGKPYVNIQDVNVIRMKNGGMEPSQWLIPDWLFAIETAPGIFKSDMDIQVIDADQTVNIRALCSGDIDGSYLPPSIVSGVVKYAHYTESTTSSNMYLDSVKVMPFAPWVKIMQNGIKIDSTRADSITGVFQFTPVFNGVYTLVFEDNRAWPTSPNAYQLDSNDVIIMRTLGYYFDSLQLKASNVNCDYLYNKPVINVSDYY